MTIRTFDWDHTAMLKNCQHTRGKVTLLKSYVRSDRLMLARPMAALPKTWLYVYNAWQFTSLHMPMSKHALRAHTCTLLCNIQGNGAEKRPHVSGKAAADTASWTYIPINANNRK